MNDPSKEPRELLRRRRAGLAPPVPRVSVECTPLAVALVCSDQGPSPEEVLGLSPGELLVVQCPGPWVGEGVLAAIDLGVKQLGLGKVIVMTHEGCPLHSLPTGPAALPATTVERMAVTAIRQAREQSTPIARFVARRQATLLRATAELPDDLRVMPVVLTQGGDVELL